MQVIFHKKALKKIEKLPKFIKEDVYEIAKLLEEFPFVRLDIKKLGGGVYRVRKGEPIIIERLDEKSLTKEGRKAMKEALEDFRKRKKENFLSLEDFKKSIES
jgi:mRNA-degrading endonuclease RelE of RelBE toxin-antitoxin system